VSGQRVELSKLWGRRPLLLVFYRGGWCPFCNFQVRAFVKAHPRFERLGVGLAMVSVDAPKAASRSRVAHEVPFDLLSDSTLDAHHAFKVTQPIEQKKIDQLRARGLDLEAASGEKHHTVAIPSMFLIDRSGVVRFAHADRDYKVRPSMDALIERVEAVSIEGAAD
jgi:peroxiredoxin